MCATIPASLIIGRLGRKRGFLLGNLIGLVGALLAAQALVVPHFGLFLLATWLIGGGIGFGQIYRFAAIEAAPAPLRDKAIDLVMGGGVIAAFADPWLARISRKVGEVPFLGSFIGLAALYCLALIILSITRLPTLHATPTACLDPLAISTNSPRLLLPW